MPAIVLEGPDGAGKTVLGHALKTVIPEAHYLKSPAGAVTGWHDAWNTLTPEVASQARITIMDRAPEISEMVYSSANGRNPRGQDLLRTWSKMAHHLGVFLVMCWPQGNPGNHYDAYGKLVDHARVYSLYEMVSYLFRQTSKEKHSLGFHNYRWWEQGSLEELLFKLRIWAETSGVKTRGPIDTRESSALMLASKGREMIYGGTD